MAPLQIDGEIHGFRRFLVPSYCFQGFSFASPKQGAETVCPKGRHKLTSFSFLKRYKQ